MTLGRTQTKSYPLAELRHPLPFVGLACIEPSHNDASRLVMLPRLIIDPSTNLPMTAIIRSKGATV